MSGGAIAGIVIGVIAALIIGIIIGYFIAVKYFKKQMKENPPITANQIRAIYSGMGRKPSESQVRRIMQAYQREAAKK